MEFLELSYVVLSNDRRGTNSHRVMAAILVEEGENLVLT